MWFRFNLVNNNFSKEKDMVTLGKLVFSTSRFVWPLFRFSNLAQAHVNQNKINFIYYNSRNRRRQNWKITAFLLKHKPTLKSTTMMKSTSSWNDERWRWNLKCWNFNACLYLLQQSRESVKRANSATPNQRHPRPWLCLLSAKSTRRWTLALPVPSTCRPMKAKWLPSHDISLAQLAMERFNFEFEFGSV